MKVLALTAAFSLFASLAFAEQGAQRAPPIPVSMQFDQWEVVMRALGQAPMASDLTNPPRELIRQQVLLFLQQARVKSDETKTVKPEEKK